MIRARRRAVRAVGFVVFTLGFVATIAAHTPATIFRAYLNKSFWRPAQRDLSELIAGLRPEPGYLPYAGMAHDGASPSLQAARNAYRALFPAHPASGFGDAGSLNWDTSVIGPVQALVNAVRPINTAETDELALLRCKVDLRAARPDDKPALARVRSCFEAYLAPRRPDALASEARGWIARVDFLSGDRARAARLYLDELSSDTSNIRRERLFNSLLAIEPSANDLEVYFDTPAHALFIANRITNDGQYEALAAPLLMRLAQHRELFGRGGESDALAIALMRAATRMGAPTAVLQYAEQVQIDGAARGSAEYNWLLGAARFQQHEYAGAEKAFRRVLQARDVDSERRRLAGNGLVGVYAEQNRPLDQLWAAFEVAATTGDHGSGDGIGGSIGALDFDVSYLLDVQLTDAQLEHYLRRFGRAPRVPFTPSPVANYSSLDTVRYALAVRHARREDYAQAARLYDALHSPRASTMKEAEQLFAATRAPDASRQRRLEAQYAYAAFLGDHEDGIFFNNLLWGGFQTEAFVYRNPDTREPPWGAGDRTARPDAEQTRRARQERRLRDDQEEYWRAYQILNGVVQQAGATPLRKQAAARAVRCLRRINTDRFGRAKEIHDADIRLSSWLIRHKDD